MKALEWLGALLLVGGLVLTAYFVVVFDVSVEVDADAVAYGAPRRVVNLGRMHDRQVGIGLSVTAFLVGGVLLTIGHLAVKREQRRRCVFCDEVISDAARICPHCRREQPVYRGGRSLAAATKGDQVDEWYREQERKKEKSILDS